MNIGFVSTWFERGAAYVTKAYMSLLEKKHNVYVYARGGEKFAKGDPVWDLKNVTWGLRLKGDSINFHHFKNWIRKHELDVLFFNEQKNIDILIKLKKFFPHLKIGAYIDYYKENTVKQFWIYDFLICNTKRHYSVFKNHPQCFYVPWGTDVDLFKPREVKKDRLTFFHSAGMSTRKGTEYVIEAFIEGKIYKDADLIIHSQKKLEESFGFDISELKKFNIKIIEKTISAPGLYHLGDVYVYPTKLDGLGLTMYEALAVGLPIIATDHPPMNEIVTNENGYLVEVEELKSRHDGYYWPLSIVKKDSLIKGMKYFVNNQEKLEMMKIKNRNEAIKKWNWKDREELVNYIFEKTKLIVDRVDESLIPKKNIKKTLIDTVSSSYIYGFLKNIKQYIKI